MHRHSIPHDPGCVNSRGRGELCLLTSESCCTALPLLQPPRLPPADAAPEDESCWMAWQHLVPCHPSAATLRGLEGAAALPGFGLCRLGAHRCLISLVCGSRAVSWLLCDLGNSVSACRGPAAPPSLLPPLSSSHMGAEKGGKGRLAAVWEAPSRLLSWTVVSSRCGVSNVCKAEAQHRCTEIKGFDDLLARWN